MTTSANSRFLCAIVVSLAVATLAEGDILSHHEALHAVHGRAREIAPNGDIIVDVGSRAGVGLGMDGVVVRTHPREVFVAKVRVKNAFAGEAVVEKTSGTLALQVGDHVFVGQPLRTDTESSIVEDSPDREPAGTGASTKKLGAEQRHGIRVAIENRDFEQAQTLLNEYQSSQTEDDFSRAVAILLDARLVESRSSKSPPSPQLELPKHEDLVEKVRKRLISLVVGCEIGYQWMSASYGPRHPEILAVQKDIRFYKSLLGEVDSVNANARTVALVDKLASLVEKEQELLNTGLGPKHPDVLRVTSQLSATRKILSETVHEGTVYR